MALFRDVRNAVFLRQQLLEGNGHYEYAFIDANVVSTRFILKGQRWGLSFLNIRPLGIFLHFLFSLKSNCGEEAVEIKVVEADEADLPMDPLYDPCIGRRV